MPSRALSCLLTGVAAAFVAASAGAQSGLQLPKTSGYGLDPTFARGWLAPDFDRFGFVTQPWREATGFAPAQRSHWSYTMSQGSFGMSYGGAANRDLYGDQRQMSLYGRYWFSQDWSLSAESMSREPGGLLRLQDFRIGVQRRF